MTSSKWLIFLYIIDKHFQNSFLKDKKWRVFGTLLTNWWNNQLTGPSVDRIKHDYNAWPPINVTFDEFNILSNVTSQSATYQFGASCPISKNKLCLSREKTTLNFNPPIQWEELNFKKIRKISKNYEDWNSLGFKSLYVLSIESPV